MASTEVVDQGPDRPPKGSRDLVGREAVLLAKRREREHVVEVGEHRLRLPQLLRGQVAHLGPERIANRVEALAPTTGANLAPDLRHRERAHEARMPRELAAAILERVGNVVEALRVALAEELRPDPAPRRFE